MTRYGPLAAAAGLLIGAAFELGGTDKDVTSPAGVALLAAGLIMLGAWLAIEVWAHRDDHRARVELDPEEE